MEKVIKEITKYLSNFDSVEKVVLFGSRARGDNKERSDIDVAIFGEVSQRDVTSIRYYLGEEVCTLLKIDCVFTAKLEENSDFFKRIQEEGIVLYEKG